MACAEKVAAKEGIREAEENISVVGQQGVFLILPPRLKAKQCRLIGANAGDVV